MLPTPLILVAVSLVFVVVEMLVTFRVARRLGNFGIVDIVWSAGFTPIVWIQSILAARYDGGEGVGLSDTLPPRLPLLIMVTLWSLRLGAHLLVRVRAHHPVEDVRYAQLRTEWGPATDRKMLGFFLLQGVLQVVLSLPWLLSCLDAPAGRSGWVPSSAWGATCFWVGLLLWAAGLFGESVADRQLARFRRDPAHRGQVCQQGLWRLSRHPNYFFEWLVWVGYGVFALASPWGWLGLAAPALMYHFLVNVTGIPMTEALSVRSKGEAYRRYQATTNAFFPGPPRHV
jgi:steroid 5-alpha reductase family enzyme